MFRFKLVILYFLVVLIEQQVSCDIGIRFTRQPEPISVPYLDIVEFECALNIPSEHVEWCHDGNLINQQSNQNYSNHNKQESKSSHILTISLNDVSLAGDYQCVAWFGASAIISTAGKLKIAEMKPFNKMPNQNYDLLFGNDLIINCPSPESEPHAYIQYLKDGTVLSNGNILQTTNSLLIKNVNVSDSGVYTCSASNTISAQEYNSPFEYHVNINSKSKTRSPYFLKEPQNQYVIEINNNVSLECNAVGNPKPKIYWTKTNKNSGFNNRTFDEGTILTIDNIEMNDAGVYTCKADNGIGPTLSYDIRLEVQESPKLIKEPETNTVDENGSIEFECIFKGTPKPKVEWYLNSKLLKNDRNIEMMDGLLRIHIIEKKHAGIYQCFGTNSVGSAFGITMLQVSPTQKEILNNDNIFEDIKMLNESIQHHNSHDGKKHKTKHHGGKNKSLKENVIMIPPTRPNITRLTDKSVMVRWNIPANNGLKIQFFKVQYKEIGSKHSRKNNRWMTSNEDIPSHIRSYEIDGLETNQTYRFRIAAVYSNNDNKLSPNSAKFHLHKGSNTNKNKPKPPSLTDTEAISPSVIQIHWQYLNSVLSPVDGFYIYYRASSSAGDYIKSTVEGQDVRTYNITHLQSNTPYEIKLQSFTVGAASDFSTILTSRTLIDPNATLTIDNTTDIVTNTIDLNTPVPTSKTYYFVIVGITIGLVCIGSVLYVVLNVMKSEPKINNNTSDDDSNDNDKIDSLTVPSQTDSTTNSINGFVSHQHTNHVRLHSNQNGHLPNGIQNTTKMNGKLSNGYVNKTIAHSHSNDDDETVNMIGTPSSDSHHRQSPPHNIGIREIKQILPPRSSNPCDLNSIMNINDSNNEHTRGEIDQIISSPPRVIPRDINSILTNNNCTDYETLNMIEGIDELSPGTRECLNIVSSDSDYNIELNYFNSRNNRNLNQQLDLDKHKPSNNNNNKKIINKNTKYNHSSINNNNSTNWRGRSVVDTRRTDNYM